MDKNTRLDHYCYFAGSEQCMALEINNHRHRYCETCAFLKTTDEYWSERYKSAIRRKQKNIGDQKKVQEEIEECKKHVYKNAYREGAVNRW